MGDSLPARDPSVRCAARRPRACTAARARSALALDVDGQTTAALDALGDGEALREVAALRALRASMLLSVGRVDQARPLLENVPAGADGAALHALRAIVRLTENAFGEAKEEAMSAVTADRDLAAGWIALSYARQAERDPQGALEAAAAACLAAPGDALAWARRAELALALSRIEEGRQHAARAVSLEPGCRAATPCWDSRSCLRAICGPQAPASTMPCGSTPTNPFAHLGRGLALIRGQPRAGTARARDRRDPRPSNAELRSTLGRAYLEEARGKVASDQFELAKRLDPASPTPWYYGAFGKLRANDPIGAIADGQRAIELNDNRAVLRSDSLLDSDRAARNADLGRAYQQLGFEASLAQAARDSLADDPANSAAHRLMADAYGEQNGFESARLSELLQARLRTAGWTATGCVSAGPGTAGAGRAAGALAGRDQRLVRNRRPSFFCQCARGLAGHPRLELHRIERIREGAGFGQRLRSA